MWRTRSALDGGSPTFGLYSGLQPREAQAPMSRTVMAETPETPRLTEERRKALNLAITQIEKSCGKGAIMRMGSDSPRVRVEAIPTGAINLDAAIRIGGNPRGLGGASVCPESYGQT